MADTKEKILHTALRLFARNGYEAASVSDIAGELGMTKGALYKHYKNKREIFNSIVERMYQVDAERAKTYEVPEETFARSPSAYRQVAMDKIKIFMFEKRYKEAFERASDERKEKILEVGIKIMINGANRITLSFKKQRVTVLFFILFF